MIELIQKILAAEIVLDVVDGKLKVYSENDEIDSEILKEIKANKEQLTSYLIQNNIIGASGASNEAIPVVPVQPNYSISNAQRRLWVLNQFDGGAVAYNLPGSTYLNRNINIENFKRAIDATIDRHEILRTVFRENESGEVRQWILEVEDLGFSIDYQDYRKEANRKEKAQAYITEDAYRAFDLAKGPLLRSALLQVEEEEYIFYYNMHHIISDAWSMEVLSKDVIKNYEAYQAGKEPQLEELRIQYRDYSVWQLAQLNQWAFEAHKSYWLEKLSGQLPLLDLPTAKQRPQIKTYNGKALSTYLDRATTAKLKEYIAENGGSLFMGLLATWNVLMHRYTSQNDIIIGVPVAGRDHADLQDQIGFYVNTLALRNEVDPEESFDNFYQALKDETLKSYGHQMYPFDRLVEELDLQRDTGRSPVFDISITYHDVTENESIGTLDDNVISQVLDNGPSKVKNDIELHAGEVENYIYFKLIYNEDVYEREMIERLMGHLKRLLKSILSHPEQKISQIDYLSEKEKHELLVNFNETAAAYPKDKTIVDLFEEQALKTPDNIAVVFSQKALTYRELNEKSNQLAHYLRDNYDIKPDSLIGIQLGRSEWVMISILGVLKAGGAYVPIDPEYPSARKEYIVKDSLLNLLITEASFIYDIDYYEGKVFAIDVEFDSEGYNTEAVSKTYTAGNLAYVIYTSGSTGNPKGVMIEHQAIANTILAQIDAFKVTSENKGLQFASFSFDASISEAFIILLSGACLFIAEESHRKDPDLLTSYIESNGIDIATLSPSYLSKIGISNLKGLKTLITAGESAHYEKVIDYIEYGTYYNAYGPTETSICGTIFKLEHVGDLLSHSVPIGKPISNTQIYILNEKGELQPVGVAGEIYIGGTGLARGYWKQESLTKEKFIASPFKAGERLYKTGDLGRWLSDGNIEFIGRKDDQVKIRGYRIELGEIEHAILKHDAINQAVVLAKENQSGEKELVAYITSHVEQNINDLRGYLRERLPLYMLPAHFVQLEAMPLTANGKVDKKSLPDAAGVGLASGVEYVAPRTAQEKVLSLVWSDVLKREGISIKDSFYNLGGDSIKSIQVVARLKQQGYRLKIEHLLRTPVLEELARLMELTAQITDQSEVSGEVLLTPIQDWFFKTEEIKVHGHYNQSVLLHSKDQLDSQLVEKSVGDLIRHHDALRMVYKQKDGVWQQFTQDTSSKCYTFNFYDLSGSDDVLHQMARLGEELQSSIKLSEGPLLRAAHFRLKDGDRLGLIVHHLVVDGVSWRILLEDLSTLYSGYKEGKKPSLALKTDSFQRWAFLQKEYAAGKKLEKERAYWQKICHQQIARLPQDKSVKEDQAALIDSSESFSLDKKTTELLQTRVHGVYNTEVNDVLLTSLGLALKEVLSSEKSVLKMEGHGREEIIEDVDISRTVGWFTTVYPFVLDVSESSSQTESLVHVKETLRSIPNKGIGYGILTHLTDEGLASKLTPEITFNYLGDFGSNVSNAADSLFEYASERIGSEVSKENTTDATLDISGMLVKGNLGMSIRYSKSRYHAATIKKLANTYKRNLELLIEELAKTKETYLTPSDLSFKGLSRAELSKINSDNTLEDVYELSPLQEGIYYHWLSETSASLYFEQTSYRVRAKALDIEKLKTAYDRLTARHAVLRTSFSTEYAGRSLQIVRKEVPSNFTYEQLDRQADLQAQVDLIRQQDRERGFNLSSGSQMRLHVIDLSEGQYEFIWSHHHILMDGWCVSVLINDFNELLSATIKGRTSNLPVVTPYSNYIDWLRAINRDSSLGYWKNYLSGYSVLAEIPFKSQTEDATYVESSENLEIGGYVLKKIDALCAELGITHNTFVQAVWGYLLSRYNNTHDVVFGAVVSGRPADLAGVEDMIGLFSNTVPVRVKYHPDDKVSTLLKSLQEQSIQSTSHHYMNLSEVQSQSELRMELIDHIMIFENFAVKELESEGALNSRGEEALSIESVNVIDQSNYDFNIAIAPSAVSLKIHIRYNTNRYDKRGLKHLVNHIEKVVNEFAGNANQSLRAIDYLSEEEKNKLLITFNETKVAYSKDKTIVDLFEEQAAKTPDSIAVVFVQKALTYRELNEKSNQLAHYLKENYDIKPDSLIGIQLDRSEWVIISILGVLKVGGAYVPIDPEYPSARKEYIVKDSSLNLLITEASFIYDIDYYEGEVFAIDVEFDSEGYNAEAVSKTYTPGNLAYVIYTSGSTGNPKGVMIEHQAIANTILAQIDAFKVTSENKGLQFASFSFDASVSETFIILLSGACLFIAEESHRKDPDLLTSYIESNGIDIATLSPSYLSKIEINNLKGLRTLITAGESAHYEKAIDHIANGTYYNAYGPTETSICGTIFKLEHVGDLLSHSVPIGKPISNTQIYILNEKEELQPVGVTGEICIGGDGLARGYLNQDDLTQEKFIASPFKAGERLYKTGDLGRWLPDGNIEFIGRKDDQVKIRGYRIELGEIEQAILSHEQIKQAVVLSRANQSGEKELVAYITSHAEQNVNDLKGYLKERLPAYMLPAHFVQLEAMPLTANGKVDKKSLPDSAGVGIASGVEYVAPRTAQEKALSLVWSDVLKREGISIKDSFYNLGGDSIKSIQVVARLKQQGYRLKIEHLLRTPVLEELARLMELTAQTTDQSEVSGEVLLTPIQDWFFKTEEIKVHNHYNQSVLLHSKDQLDSQLVEKSIADLTRHHDALRMVYKQKEGAWQQFNRDASSKCYTFNFHDLREVDDAHEQMARLGEELQSSISIGEGPLFRVAHFRLKDGDRLGLIVHHLVVDGVSWRILLEDLSTLYIAYKEGKKTDLPLKTDSFQRWTLLQKEYAESKELEKERAYWQKICDRQLARLPQDKSVKEDQAALIDSSESFSLDKKTTELLQTRVHGVYNTEVNDVLLTSLGLALKEVLSVEKSVLKMEGHGREEIIEGVDISRTVGWFTTVYPFVLDVSESSSQTESLVSVKEALRSIPKKGIGYGILTHMADEGLESKLTPEITFNYLGDFGSNVSNAAESLFEYASERIGSDFSKENTTDATLDISGMLVKEKLGMSIRYSKSRYHAATIKKLAESYKQNLELLIEGLSKSPETHLTPSDLSFKGLSLEEVSRLNAENNLEDIYELSPLQEGIYYHWLSETSTSLYFEQTSYRVRAKALEIEKLKTAYDQLTARHAVLRTSFSTEYAGRSLQIVRKEVSSNFTYEQLDRHADRQAQAELIKQQDRERGFDLSSGSQMRLHVIDLSEGQYEFIWSHHHILMDGWCVSVLINDFNELLIATIKGLTSNLPAVTPYSNYITWLRAINEDSSLGYWKNYLSGYSALAEIPFKAQTEDTTYAESSERLEIRGEVLKKVDALCIELGITHNTFVQAAWGYLLSRYNNTNDVVFGAVVSGRPADLPGVEDMIGLFINTVPVRVKYDPDDKVAALLKSLQEHSIQSTSHHYMNLSEVQSQSELGVQLMDHIMIFENYAVKELENEGTLNNRGEEVLSIASVDVFERTNYDFNVIVSPSDVSLGVIIKYNINRYDQVSLKNLVRHFDKLIHGFAKDSDQPLRAIDYLSEEERHELLVTFNDTAVAYPKDRTIVGLFEEQAAKTPDSIAVVFEDKELTYRELNEKSNQLAHYLRENYDIQPDDFISIRQARSEWTIVSILAVLKSGGAYVPIDPEYPKERIAYIEQDTNCKVCLDEVVLSKFKDNQEDYSKESVISTVQEDHLAYVIYTSGSTGKPKGVMIEHRNAYSFIKWSHDEFKDSDFDTVLFTTSLNFDLSVFEIFHPLTRGKELQVLKDGLSIPENIGAGKKRLINTVPSVVGALLQQGMSFKSVSVLNMAGEPIPSNYRKELRGKVKEIRNLYGPSEDTTYTTVFRIDEDERDLIGKPIANTQIYIVNEQKELQPVGVIGEICIGGDGLARGYLNQENLTKEKFIASPFKEGERLYKTGDLGRWLPDGNIEFLGRRDDQVKIRGYRIELGEIEQALLSHEQISQAVVIAKKKQSGEKELVAYITSEVEQNTGELKAYLRETLPTYMLPAYLVQLEAMPLTATGKIDKKSLPDPGGLQLTSGVEYVAPRNELEEKLVKIWEQVLQRENIGVQDDFFALGGHSIKAVRLSNEYQKQLAVKLNLKDLFVHTSIASQAARIESSRREAFIQIEKVTPQASYPISDAQRRLWVLSQFEGGSVAYNIPSSAYLNQGIEIGNLTRAIDAVVDRHEILRTVFREDESGELRQWVLEREDLGFVIDYRDFRKEADRNEKAKAYIAADAHQPFDLENGPLLRAALLQVEEGEYVFYFNMHHIVSDGWSMEVLSKDVFKYYEAYQAGKEPGIGKLRIQYKDYSAWQLAQLKDESFKAHKGYWLEKLSGELPLLDLPTTKQRPKVMTYNGHSIGTYLDKATTAKLKGYIRENGGSLFMVLLASWNVLIYRYTSQKDIIIGTPVAGRGHADLEDQIGFYVNTLVLRNEVNPEESFDDFYQALKDEALKSYSHQMYPFDRLVDELGLQRDTSRSAVFDVMFALQNNGEKIEGVKLSEEQINQVVDQGSSTSKFDLDITAREIGDYLSLSFIFNTDIYEKSMVEGLIRHYRQLVNAVLEAPQEKISQIDYLSEKEKHELLVTFNDITIAYPKNRTIVDLFEEQVATTPDRIAVIFEDRELTYRELNEKSNQLAHYLRGNYHIQPDDLVGIKQARSEWMIICILGVLKSGGAYVPIDPEYPQERIDYIEEDTKCKVCLDETELNKFKESQEDYSKEALASAAGPGNLIYVIYTSGSTGKPKGVMIEHGSVVARINYFREIYQLTEKDNLIFYRSYSFDGAIEEYLVPLMVGAKCCVAPSGFNRDIVSNIISFVERHSITKVNTPPVLLSELIASVNKTDLQKLLSLRIIVSGGDKLTMDIVNAFLSTFSIALYNAYGPTENTDDSTNWKAEKSANISVPIGRPVPNSQVYILDEHLGLVPVGSSGELYVSGAGLARGYLNRPELTKERFIDNPYRPGTRMYKTGDLGRWLPDGNIEFLGRNDHQVKIRGHRIELEEIEQGLLRHEEINHAVVLAKESPSGEKELVAYITSGVEQNASDLRAYLKETLPAYMLPGYFVQLVAMPLNVNGKIDRKLLPDPEGLGLESGVDYVAPGNETEEKLVKIWQDVLQRKQIGVNDDFFALGGHSLKALRLSNEYQKALGVKLALKDLFIHTSLSSHAALIESSAKEEFVQIERVASQKSYAISDGQRRLWVLSQFEGGSVSYNMPNHTYLDQHIEIENFKRAIDATIERHEILRTVIREDESGELRQWVLEREALGFAIDYRDFRKEADRKAKTRGYIAADAAQEFDLEKGPLLRAALLQVADKEYVFYFNMHHIISDGWSTEVLAKDVLKYYEAYQAGRAPAIKELRLQYKDYSSWQLAQLNGASFKAHKKYWLDKLSGELPLLDLPTTKQRPKVMTYNGHTLVAYLDKTTTARLRGYVQKNGGSLFMGLLASWNVLVYRYTAQRDIIIGTPVAGRDHADLEDQIGFYVNTLVLRNEIDPEETFDSFYQTLKENTLESYSHQMYPFDRLVEELNLQKDTSRSAVFDVMLTVQNNGEKIEGIKLSEDQLSQIVDQGSGTSKFDLDITAQEIGDYLSLNIVFNPDIYEKAMMEGLIRHYKRLLNALLETPEEKNSQIVYLSEEEKHKLLLIFNNTTVVYPKDRTIVDLFEEQAARIPDAIAVIIENKELTYRELNERSNQLAHYLRDRYDIGPDDLIGIMVGRSELAIITLLGVLKSGGAYVPIDPEYSTDRVAHIIKDSGVKMLLLSEEVVLEGEENIQSVFVSDIQGVLSSYPSDNMGGNISGGDLAYVIYTSASTGQPKGVKIEHRNLLNISLSWRDAYGLQDIKVKALQMASMSFDVFTGDVCRSLLNGGTLVICPSAIRLDLELLCDLLLAQEINIVESTPGLIVPLVQYARLRNVDLSFIKLLIIGSDTLLVEDYKDVKEYVGSTTRVLNSYGITEATIDSSYYESTLDGLPGKRIVPIGKPLHNISFYILDDRQELVPIGVTGELYIAGAGVGRGYINLEALTAERFLPDPFKEGERMYRTGDLARWMDDGNVEFLGRRDYQVKIRGHRIELEEVEHSLLKHEEISQAVVLAKESPSGGRELVAYIKSKIEQNTSDLRAYLKETLPAYMLPAYYVQLETMPLTANGKIDKKSLPDPEGLGITSGVEYVAPGTEQEKVIALVWSDVLRREGIGTLDNFYNLGGDSIKSIQVVARLKQRGYKLKVEHLLRTPVLEELARLMELNTQVIDQREVNGDVLLTPIQEWFFEAAEIRERNHYNQSVLLYSKAELNSNILEKTIDDLTRHHDALRMVYKQKEGSWQQYNQDVSSKHYSIDFYDLREVADARKQIASLGEELQAGIKLSEGPLLRVAHFRLKDGDRLGLIIHHLVVDGVSWRILMEDISTLYTSYKEGKKPRIPLKTDSFQRWALLQKEYAASEKLEKERTYWRKICNRQIAGLPQDKAIKEDLAAVIDSSESFSLDMKTTELLQTRVHGVYNTEINDVLLAGFGLALKEVLSVDESVLKMEGHGREEIIDGVDISRTVGWFTTLYPFILDVSDSSPTENLINVKESLRGVPNKGIGYGILTYLSDERLVSKLRPEITFNYLGDFGSKASNAEDTAFEYASERMGSDVSKNNVTDETLDVSGMLVRGELGMSIGYSRSGYDASTIRKLAESYKKNLEFLIGALSKSKETHLTPSDLSFRGLSRAELSRLNADNTLEDVYELSPLQEGIYYHWLADTSTSLYFEQTSYRVRAKELDIEKLKEAYDRLTARHAVLRTSFSTEYAGRSLQIVRKQVPSNFTCQNLDRRGDQQAQVEQIKRQDRERGFDLSKGSQMRLHIVDLSEGAYEFIWSHHHVLMDGWCVSVLINDFNELLSAAVAGRELKLPPPLPYSNYINWIKAIDRESSLGYWKNYLSGYSTLAEIPFKVEEGDTRYVESSERLQIGGDLLKKVDTLCTQLGITHSTFVQGVWGYLLSRYNNTNDVVFGAVVSGRPADLAGVEDMIGLFINTIPVRVKYHTDDTPVKLLRSLHEQSITSTRHHYMNLSEVQAQSELGMDLMHHIMIFENYAVKELENEGALNSKGEDGLSIESVEVFDRTNYDFNIIVSPSNVALGITIKYNLNSYDQLSLKNLIMHFDKLIGEFAQKSDQALGTIDYLSEAEKHKLLVTFNDTATAYPKDKTVVDLFEVQAAKTPDQVAIVFEGGELTYRELNESSNQLAHYLRESYDIQPDDLIGIKQGRSEWMIISVLAVLKSGGAYVPIDPEYPHERITYIEQDTKCKVSLDEKALSEFQERREGYSKGPLCFPVKENHLAYVMYTSGSTGVPKGVMVEHRSIVRLVCNTNFFTPAANDRLVLTGALSFDATTFEIWSMLLFGGQLHLLPKNRLMEVVEFKETMQREKISVLWLTAGLFDQIVDTDLSFFSALRYLVSGGDKMSPEHVNKVRKAYPELEIVNGYGPTENTTFSACYRIKDKEYKAAVPIGKPIANSQVYILDSEMQLVPIGVVGEIYTAGDGLAIGYLNQEELTKQKFKASPFREGERVYKTGDLGRWLPDGNIAFVGRIDDQVKISGYRIELGEIEHTLLRYEAINQAVVLAMENQSGEKELVAYITSNDQQNINDLRTYLRETLPAYMLPAYFIQLEAMPLTVNGKLDKKSLPDPEGMGLTSGVEYVAPRNETEQKLIEIWEMVLGRKNIGMNDDFFDLGGFSMRAMGLIAEYNKSFNVRLTIQEIFERTKLYEHARMIETQLWIKTDSEEKVSNMETFEF